MSSIAQKLCDEICEKPTKPSKQNVRESNRKLYHASSSRYDSRPTRSIVIEKKRVINKVVPSDISSKSKIINKFKSKETLLNKKFIDTGLNTVITGPLRCDNDCVTMVRKRDSKAPCKCSFKGLKCITSAKQIQTLDIKNYSHLDKACAHGIETVNCGTQFFERSRRPMDIKSKVKVSSEVNTQTAKQHSKNMDFDRAKPDPTSKSNIYNYMGARRWALSHYPTRGPDF